MYTLRPPTLPRHPLLRALVLVGGALLLAAVLTAGLLLGAAVVACAALTLVVRRWLGRGRQPATAPGTIDGEFTVLPRRALPRTD